VFDRSQDSTDSFVKTLDRSGAFVECIGVPWDLFERATIVNATSEWGSEWVSRGRCGTI